jgi:hypothetical protein
MTTALQCKNFLKSYTLAGFEPGIFCSLEGRDGHSDTPPKFPTSLKKLAPDVYVQFEC